VSKILVFIIGLLLITGCETSPTPKHMGKDFRSVPATKAHIYQKGQHKESCAICGMNLAKFYKTNHLATLTNKSKRQYCSLHCVVYDNEFNKTDLINLKVVDAKTLKFIPAITAYYVVGSSKPATMSKTSKYAFARKKDAIEFSKKYGGKIMQFYDAYEVATKDFTNKRR